MEDFRFEQLEVTFNIKLTAPALSSAYAKATADRA